MTAAEARASRAFVLAVAKAAGCRRLAVERVLDGYEVWPATYERIAAELGARDVQAPPMAVRAPRVPPPKPCAECARLRASRDSESRVAESWRQASGRIVAAVAREPCLVATPDETERVVADLVRRYAKLRAFAARIVEQCRDDDEEIDRFMRAGERERAAIVEWLSVMSPWMTPVQAAARIQAGEHMRPTAAITEEPTPRAPDATTEALRSAVGRPCRVRVEMADGTAVDGLNAAGPYSHGRVDLPLR